ncbi:hypothetical protein GCM10009847_00850 [Leucobacter tardus]|uniref:TetR/AcrR family transcriptional regulator n=1 Tax=Leucobacter tardus TaxID=501483 RepID=A0A939QFQ4_9MICO|nr:TetR/AcrR family transcriptional regulator [Leucobacter tardus]MBO2990997.1 TetR/AcrR family transcriptional regulator [Leucobacter tardus]
MAKRQPGRPFSTEITTDLLEAAERAMERGGYSNLTVDTLVREAGTTRATFYRRFTGASHLAFEVLAAKFGDVGDTDTGSLLGDLTEVQRADVQMLSSQLMRNNLAGLLEAMRTDDQVRELFTERFLAPRRESIRLAVDRAAERGELGAVPGIDIEELRDLMIGPIIARILLPTGGGFDAEFAERTAETAHRHALAAVGIATPEPA